MSDITQEVLGCRLAGVCGLFFVAFVLYFCESLLLLRGASSLTAGAVQFGEEKCRLIGDESRSVEGKTVY